MKATRSRPSDNDNERLVCHFWLRPEVAAVAIDEPGPVTAEISRFRRSEAAATAPLRAEHRRVKAGCDRLSDRLRRERAAPRCPTGPGLSTFQQLSLEQMRLVQIEAAGANLWRSIANRRGRHTDRRILLQRRPARRQGRQGSRPVAKTAAGDSGDGDPAPEPPGDRRSLPSEVAP